MTKEQTKPNLLAFASQLDQLVHKHILDFRADLNEKHSESEEFRRALEMKLQRINLDFVQSISQLLQEGMSTKSRSTLPVAADATLVPPNNELCPIDPITSAPVAKSPPVEARTTAQNTTTNHNESSPPKDNGSIDNPDALQVSIVGQSSVNLPALNANDTDPVSPAKQYSDSIPSVESSAQIDEPTHVSELGQSGKTSSAPSSQSTDQVSEAPQPLVSTPANTKPSQKDEPLQVIGGDSNLKSSNDSTAVGINQAGKEAQSQASSSVEVASAHIAESSPVTPSVQSSISTSAPLSTDIQPGQVPPINSNKPKMKVTPPTFRLPNAKVGVAYSARVIGSHESGAEIAIRDVRLTGDLGLNVNPTTQEITGEPLLSGEFEITFQWSYTGAEGWISGGCKLISNPDPRSLWKIIEPDTSLPDPKSHTDTKLISSSSFRIAAASRRGRSHEHMGSFREDDFFIDHNQATGWSVIIVADGAGSAKSSREGSRIAVQTSGHLLVEALAGDLGEKVSASLSNWDKDTAVTKEIGDRFYSFFHEMAKTAIEKIEQRALSQTAPVKDYSTTLLVAAIKKEGERTFLATFWMGDGAIAAYGPSNTVKLMGSPDGGEFAGQTRFLDSQAISDASFSKRVSVGYLQNLTSIILMTDGVSDPRFETDNG
jgi:serine/threonine protein phosphatase PrpC